MFSWVEVPRNMKNYLRGSSMEQRLVNTGVGHELGSLRFISQFTVSGTLPAYYSMNSAGSSPPAPWKQSYQSRKLTTQVHLLLRLKTSGQYLSFHKGSSWCARPSSPFTFLINRGTVWSSAILLLDFWPNSKQSAWSLSIQNISVK